MVIQVLALQSFFKGYNFGTYTQNGRKIYNTGILSQRDIINQSVWFSSNGTVNISDQLTNLGLLSGDGIINATVVNDCKVNHGNYPDKLVE